MAQCICGRTWCQAWNRCPNRGDLSQPHGEYGTEAAIRAQQEWDERGDVLAEIRRAVEGWRLVGDRSRHFADRTFASPWEQYVYEIRAQSGYHNPVTAVANPDGSYTYSWDIKGDL